jgi:glutamyl-tRNA reductase
VTLFGPVKFIFGDMSLIDNYKVITVTHHNLNISEIGNFYVKVEEQENPYIRLKKVNANFQIQECVYLETCNRVCYIFFGNLEMTNEFLKDFFNKINPSLDQTTLNGINSFVDVYEGECAIKHVFELASSMDSLVVGEREIFRQLRTGFNHSRNHGLSGDYLRILEKSTVETAKKIYSSTKIGEKALSVVSLAVQSLLEMEKSKDQRVLLIGTGETNSLVGKFLKKYQMLNVTIYNRSLDNAKGLSDFLSAKSFHLNELKNANGQFDTIIICTSANKHVIDEKLYRTMLNGDQSKKLIIDLAVPRNVSEKVIESYDVNYIDINSLKSLSENNLCHRKSEMAKAKPIIKKEIAEFRDLFQRRLLEKALSSVPVEIKKMKEKAVGQIYNKRIAELDDSSKILLMEMMDYMEKKCISIPIKAAKEELKV